MKKNIIISILIAILFVSCDLFTPKAKNTVDIVVEMPTSKNVSSKSILDDVNVNSVKARFFYTSNKELMEDGEISLTKKDDHWEGSITYNPNTILGNVDIHAMGFSNSDGTGEILYQGTVTDVDINTIGASTPISTIAGYSVGDRGPGGGWVIYANTEYVDDTLNEMGKNWRYLEIAPQDLEESWTADKIDTTTHQIIDGEVYTLGTSPELVLTKKDYYWSVAGTLGTSQTFEFGNDNTTTLDGVSTATPKVTKISARKDIVENTDNIRRDTVDSLKAKNINNLSDWFIPSKEELESVYDNKSQFTNISGHYWTSSEDNDGIDKTSDYPGLTQGTINQIKTDEYWAYSIDFDNNTKDNAITVSERFRTYNVRPIRAF